MQEITRINREHKRADSRLMQLNLAKQGHEDRIWSALDNDEPDLVRAAYKVEEYMLSPNVRVEVKELVKEMLDGTCKVCLIEARAEEARLAAVEQAAKTRPQQTFYPTE